MKYIKPITEYLKESQNEDNPQQFQYMMLGRLRSDCDYFLGWGKGHGLYYGDVNKHIEEMKKLWNELVVKPEWLTYEEILDYEQKMLDYSK